jgi:hypothetical protein
MFGGTTGGRSAERQKGKSMSKKMMLLALSVVSAALFALPAVAAATTAHLSATSTFTVSKGATETVELETTGGEKVQCHSGVSGKGSFVTTTTGNLELTFHGCTTTVPIFGTLNCSSSGAPTGTIVTTTLPFHLISKVSGSGTPGVLITPAAGEHFATFVCGGIAERKVTGNGVIGTITSPGCGVASLTATLKFEQGATGVQKHATHTGVTYGLKSNGTPAAQIAEGKITFPAPRSITCT